MEKEIIKVKEQNGEIKDAEIILAFEHDNKKFAIYTFNEEDENGMVILYSSQINDEGDEPKFEKISPEDWSMVKEVMNDIVKEWKEQ